MQIMLFLTAILASLIFTATAAPTKVPTSLVPPVNLAAKLLAREESYYDVCESRNHALMNAIGKFCTGPNATAIGPGLAAYEAGPGGFNVTSGWAQSGMTSDADFDNDPHKWSVGITSTCRHIPADDWMPKSVCELFFWTMCATGGPYGANQLIVDDCSTAIIPNTSTMHRGLPWWTV